MEDDKKWLNSDGRLCVNTTIESRNYVLDPVGNDTANGGEFNELNQLTQDNDFLFEYDLNGNQLKKTNKTTGERFEYFWTAENQLTKVEIYNGSNVLTKTLNYGYDGYGRRIFREVENHLTPSKSYIHKFIYDGDHVLAILDGENSVLASYLFGPNVDDPIAMVFKDSRTQKLEKLSFVKDHQNSVRVVVKDDGSIAQQIAYTAYGKSKILEPSKDKFVNYFYYTSRELEPETGDYFYRARYYNPVQARFLSEDPLGIDGKNMNLYAYVNNNPLIYNDPTGKSPEWIDDGFCYITGRCDPSDVDSPDWGDTFGDMCKEVWDWIWE